MPDHVLARQTVDDCLHEGLSVEGLVDVWAQVESGAIDVHTVESVRALVPSRTPS